VRLGSAAVVGGAAGAALLLSLPARAFSTVAPYLVGIAVLLVLFGPRLTDALRHTGHQTGTRVSPALWLLIAGAAVYGGYFGPAMSMILMGVMGVFVQESLQRLNGLKNLLAALVNGVAASVFLFTGSMDFAAAGLLAVGATAGGLLGAKVAKRLPPAALRALIVVVGILALIKLIA